MGVHILKTILNEHTASIMKSYLIFIAGMFTGAFLLILFLFAYDATNPDYEDGMLDWRTLENHGCEDRWDAPKQAPREDS